MTRFHLLIGHLSARFARLWRRINYLACSVFLKRTESPADHGQASQPDPDPGSSRKRRRKALCWELALHSLLNHCIAVLQCSIMQPASTRSTGTFTKYGRGCRHVDKKVLNHTCLSRSYTISRYHHLRPDCSASLLCYGTSG